MKTHRRRLLENIAFLYLLRGTNYIVPLAVFPFLVRVLGIEVYGLVAVCQAVAQYFTIVTDYGFNFSATRSIAQRRDDPDAISTIFSQVYLIKLLLLLAGLVLLLLIVLTVRRFRPDASFVLVAYLAVVGNVLFPLWYFQGTEKMRLISILSGIPKLASAVCVFVFVRRPEDALLAIGIQSSGLLIAGALGLIFALRDIRFHFVLPPWKGLRDAMEEGWHLFASSAAVTLYLNGTVLLVGLLAGNAQAGYFSLADKICRGTIGLLEPITQALFPHISSMTIQSREAVLRFLRKSLLAIGSVSFAGSLLLFIFAKRVGLLFFGIRAEAGGLETLRWMSSLPFVIGVSSVLAIQVMIPFRLDRQLSRIYVIAGFSSLVLSIPLILQLAARGAGISVVVVETAIIIAMWGTIRRSGIDLLRGTGVAA
jgi:polysaccharide transporter, PST family